MATVSPSWLITQPAYMEPGLLLQYNQASGAFYLLAGGNPLPRIGNEDKYVYIRRADVRAKVQVNQAAGNLIPSCSIAMSMIATPTYLQRVRAEYDHHDTAMMTEWGVNIVEAQRLAMRQGHYQLARNNLLFGVIPANGEGMLNASGATTVSLPPDPFGNQTVLTYDPGAFAQFLLSQFAATKTRTMQLGIPRRFVILGPQRVMSLLEYPNIVQLTSYQRAGAGSQSTAGMVKDVASWNGDTVEWCYDDTLQSAGSGGGNNDVVIIAMPEVEKPHGAGWNTNEFATLEPGLAACNLMYSDVPAPIEIPTPLPGGAIDVLSEMRVSPGWAVRPENLTIINLVY